MLTAMPYDQSQTNTSQSSVDPEAFYAFERAGWEHAAFWDSQ